MSKQREITHLTFIIFRIVVKLEPLSGHGHHLFLFSIFIIRLVYLPVCLFSGLFFKIICKLVLSDLMRINDRRLIVSL